MFVCLCVRVLVCSWVCVLVDTFSRQFQLLTIDGSFFKKVPIIDIRWLKFTIVSIYDNRWLLFQKVPIIDTRWLKFTIVSIFDNRWLLFQKVPIIDTRWLKFNIVSIFDTRCQHQFSNCTKLIHLVCLKII